jgi:4'-phosphopantetheinyl transferase
MGDAIELSYAFPELITDEETAHRCRDILSTEELDRLRRLVGAAERHRFLIAHALVRCVLSSVADVPPATWRFTPGEQGRPEIVEPRGLPPLCFNLTHPRGFCACVVARGHQVGVDAERIDRDVDYLGVAGRLFSPADAQRLEQLSPRQRRSTFFSLWTLREACVKARGEGMLRTPREALSFRLEGDGAPAVSFGSGWEDDVSRWRLFQLQPSAEHHCSVAVRSDEPELLDLVVREAGGDMLCGGATTA